MSSKSEPLDLERDVPTTPEDVEALRRIRESRRLSFAEYLLYLSSLPHAPAREKTHEGFEPFEL